MEVTNTLTHPVLQVRAEAIRFVLDVEAQVFIPKCPIMNVVPTAQSPEDALGGVLQETQADYFIF